MVRNFFLIVFQYSKHMDVALHATPWFMGKQYMYTFSWDPSFAVGLEIVTKMPI